MIRVINKRVRAFIERGEASGSLPADAGVAVAVLRGRDTVFRSTYGLRDRERKLSVTPQTVFEVGSLTKAFTVTSLLIATEAGLVDLDQPINANAGLLKLSDPEVSEQISLADILSHRTGLPSNDLFWYLGAPAKTEVLAAIAGLALVPDAFRRRFIYSNLMYGAVGHLFHQLVGEDWSSYVVEHILNPLRLTSTSFASADGECDVALPYLDTRRMSRLDLTSVAAAGAMRSTLEDMTRWIAFQLDKSHDGERFLSDSSVQRMRRPHIGVDGANPMLFHGLCWVECVGYGLGWFLGSIRGRRVLFHPGFTDGFSSALVLLPEEGIGCIVLMNVNLSDAPGHLIAEILGELLGKDITPDVEQPTAVIANGALFGRYRNEVYGTLTVVAEGDTLAVEYKGRRWPLTWTAPACGQFVVTAFGLDIPLTITFDHREGRAHRLSIPFSLDPRVEPQSFVRVPD